MGTLLESSSSRGHRTDLHGLISLLLARKFTKVGTTITILKDKSLNIVTIDSMVLPGVHV